MITINHSLLTHLKQSMERKFTIIGTLNALSFEGQLEWNNIDTMKSILFKSIEGDQKELMSLESDIAQGLATVFIDTI